MFGKKAINTDELPLDDWQKIKYNPEDFAPDSWKNKPEVEKNKALQGLANQIAKEKGIDSQPVVVTNLGASLYDHDNKVIKIDKEELKLPERAAFRIGHEAEHPFQRVAVEGKLSEDAQQKAHIRYGGEDAFNKKVAEWKINYRKGAYYDPTKPDYKRDIPVRDELGKKDMFTLYEQNRDGGYVGGIHYQSQPVEIGANLAGRQTLQRVKNDLDKLGKGIDTSGFQELIDQEGRTASAVARHEIKAFGADPTLTILNNLTKRAEQYSKNKPDKQKTPKHIKSPPDRTLVRNAVDLRNAAEEIDKKLNAEQNEQKRQKLQEAKRNADRAYSAAMEKIIQNPNKIKLLGDMEDMERAGRIRRAKERIYEPRER